MNSLEKLIEDLHDSWGIIADQRNLMIKNDIDPAGDWANREQLAFVMNAIQCAINRLDALLEEQEQGE